MSKLDLNALNELPKVDRILALAETNAQLEKLDAEGRVAWALDNLPGEYVLSSSFGIQAAVSLHLVNQIRPDIPVILTDTGYLFAVACFLPGGAFGSTVHFQVELEFVR